MHELLAEGDFVRALARQLVAGADADDVAQEAWLAALRQRPTGLHEPRSWLARVVHRLAANRLRSERRRTTHEREAGERVAREAPSTEAILACEQVRQRVVAAVLVLDEPFRGTVLARFYECLDSDAIAARDGVEVATVRSRLRRGLERLRSKLDDEHGGRRSAWAAPLGLLHENGSPLAIPTGVLMSTSKKVAAAAAVLMFAGLAWVVSLADFGPAPFHGAPEVVASPVAAADAGEGRATAADERRDAGAAAAVATGPSERLPYPVIDEPTTKLTVCVLDLATRRPVADAEVLYQPFRLDLGHERARGDRELHEMASSEAFRDRFGSRVRTQANGEAVIELPRSGGWVRAQHGDRIAAARPDPDQIVVGERFLLWLDEARWLRFRVVDEATGAPVAGALLEISSSATGPIVPGSGGSSGNVGPSDRDGLIRTPWARDRASLRVRSWTLGGRRSMPLDMPAALDRVTEVPYPATGSLTIELRTPSGNLWPTSVNASVQVDGGDSWSSAGPTGWCTAAPGIYRVPHIGLGLRLQVSASPARLYGVGGKRTVAGPTQPCEDVRVVLQTTIEPCIAWADLRFADGSLPPLVSMATVLQDCTNGDAHRNSGYLEPGGRIGWTVDLGGPLRGRITLQTRDGDAREAAHGEWQLESATPGVHELGTIVVKEPDVVVAGLVDRGVHPSSGPDLWVDCETPAADGTWERAYGLSARVRADGSFEVRGVTNAARLRVSLRGDRRVLPPDPVVVALGSLDVRLVVASSVTLRARVLPPPAYLQAVTCHATRVDGVPLPSFRARPYDDETPFADAKLIATDGEAAQFAWPALPPGVYSIEVRVPGMAAPVHIVDGVRVEAGGEPDARLAAIDLRRAVRILTVVVEQLPSGRRPITDGGVLAWPSGQASGARYGMLFDAAGHACIAIGAQPVDVLVAVPGCRLWRAEGVTTTSLAVKLEPCVTIAFRLAPRVADAFAGHEVLVWVEPKYRHEDSPGVRFLREGDRQPAVWSSLGSLQRLAGDGTCTLADSRALGAIPVSEFGTFRLIVTVRVGPGYVAVNESWLNRQRSPLLPATIEWTAADQQPVVIDVDADVLAKVRDELSRPR